MEVGSAGSTPLKKQSVTPIMAIDMDVAYGGSGGGGGGYRSLFGEHSPPQHLQQQQQLLFPDYPAPLQQHQQQQHMQQLHQQHQQHFNPVSLYDLPRPEKVPVSTISYLPQHPAQHHLTLHQSQQPSSSYSSGTDNGYNPLILHQSDPGTGAPVVSMVTTASASNGVSAAPVTAIATSFPGYASSSCEDASCSPISSSASNQRSPAAHGRNRRGSSANKKAVPDDLKDSKYFERRQRNNAAAKKSRDARKQREDLVAVRANNLEKENASLRSQLASLREEVNSLREMVRLQQQQQVQQQIQQQGASVS